MIELTNREAYAIAGLIDLCLLDTIRNDPDIDNMDWLCEVVSVYNKCKENIKKVSNKNESDISD